MSHSARRLPLENRPNALPSRWGAHFVGDDLARRSGMGWSEAEPIYGTGMLAAQMLLKLGGVPWSLFEVDVFTGYLCLPENFSGLPRVIELLGQLDLLADYLCCCDAISAYTRDQIIADAQRAIAKLERSLH